MTHQPCYRHPRHIWMAGCADCTAWHQAARAEHRDDAAAQPEPTGTRPRGAAGRRAAA